jgi:hypothetical protein
MEAHIKEGKPTVKKAEILPDTLKEFEEVLDKCQQLHLHDVHEEFKKNHPGEHKNLVKISIINVVLFIIMDFVAGIVYSINAKDSEKVIGMIFMVAFQLMIFLDFAFSLTIYFFCVGDMNYHPELLYTKLYRKYNMLIFTNLIFSMITSMNLTSILYFSLAEFIDNYKLLGISVITFGLVLYGSPLVYFIRMKIMLRNSILNEESVKNLDVTGLI